ncbi:hypothetical protein COCON_G00041510 [Conger conger]|uniref:BZIP domain-containing protein n=1 Tax=Conger conger TaxID=82655 RepID=A0A9Q1DTP6_CONCO|nr:hypothetical protein COCON_G00041510 [Conger conger]
MHLLTGIRVLMETKPGGSLTSISGDDSASDTGKCLRTDRTCKRKEKNRVAAQKSRKKQTERADVLHQELQALEQSNVAYEKEIAMLRLEIEQYSSALKRHEPQCNLLIFSAPETLLGAPAPAPVPAPAPAPAPAPVPILTPAATPPTELSLPDLLTSLETEWPQYWDSW